MKTKMLSWKLAAPALLLTTLCYGQYFGRVVALGGHTSDLALDEARGVAYVANFTANRIDVVSLSTQKVTKSMNVASQPSAISLSPSGRHLVTAHYGNFVSPESPRNALTVIDLTTNGRQTFALADPPLGVAFGADGRALVVTTEQFILFEPFSGSMSVLDTVAGVTAKTLPQPPANFPTQIVAASVSASGDRLKIAGVTDTILFKYDVVRREVLSYGYVAEPKLGPRTISVSQTGDRWLAGWAIFDDRGALAQFADPSGILHIGSHAIDHERNTIYAQVTQSDEAGGTNIEGGIPELKVVDADNLRVRDRLRLRENLSGKAVLSADGTTMYALSESGLTILPVGDLHGQPMAKAAQQDIVFRGSGCGGGTVTQYVDVYDPGGKSVPFRIKASTSGIRLSQSSGNTPATIVVTVDPSTFQNTMGTTVAQLDITSTTAVNFIDPVRVLINLQDPDQRGTSFNVPGKLVDLVSDPQRNRFFILRQSTNEVLVFDGSTYEHVASLRTGNTPTSMSFTFDRRYLMVGNDNSQYANVYDLETLDPSEPIRFPFGHYPRWLAASGNAILAATRVAGPIHKIDNVDFWSRTATELPSLGVYENTIDINTALVAAPNGNSIMAAQADGNLLLYNASADTFTISRKDEDELGGAVAASNFDQFVVGNTLYNASLVPMAIFDTTIEASSGFVFVDQTGFRTGTQSGGGTGVIQRVDLNTGAGLKSTRLAEAPVAGNEGVAFTRSAAMLPNRSAIINLTTSGFTVVPWN
jgi:DNA-binding beta-propeller fold protein YncE